MTVKENNGFLLIFVDHFMLHLSDGKEEEAGLVDILRTTIETSTDDKRPFRRVFKQKPCSMKCRSILGFLIPAFSKSKGLWTLFVDMY